MAKISVKTATIAPNISSVTGEIDLESFTLMAIEMPATWTGTTLTFQSKGEKVEGNPDGWKDVYDDEGSEVTVTVAQNRIIGINAAALKLGALRYIRIRSGTAASPTQQNALKTLRLILKH